MGISISSVPQEKTVGRDLEEPVDREKTYSGL